MHYLISLQAVYADTALVATADGAAVFAGTLSFVRQMVSWCSPFSWNAHI